MLKCEKEEEKISNHQCHLVNELFTNKINNAVFQKKEEWPAIKRGKRTGEKEKKIKEKAQRVELTINAMN